MRNTQTTNTAITMAIKKEKNILRSCLVSNLTSGNFVELEQWVKNVKIHFYLFLLNFCVMPFSIPGEEYEL